MEWKVLNIKKRCDETRISSWYGNRRVNIMQVSGDQGRRSDLVGPRRDLRFTYTKKI